MSSGEGAWAKAGEAYKMRFGGEGQEIALDVDVKEKQMVARLDGRVLVFDRI